MSSGIYNISKAEIAKKNIDLVNDTIKVALMNEYHSFNPSTSENQTWNDVKDNEISGTNYTSGGQALTGKKVTPDNVSNCSMFDADDLTWSSSTITAYHAVIYDDSSSLKYIIGSIDFGGPQTSNGGNFTLEWEEDGIILLI